MALDTQLQTIASGAAGIYMLEQDNSQTQTIVADNRRRLIITNIPKGRVNSVAEFAAGDTTGFISEFGDIDPRQERLGNFSVRSCLIALENGPISVLNLRNFDDTLDRTQAIEISSVAGDANGTATQIPYTQVFDTSRFWKIDARNLVADNSTRLINFANIGNKKISVYIRKSKVTGYDIKVKEYYDTLNRPVPLNVDPEALFSDFMVDVYFFANDFNDIDRALANENYGYLFTKKSSTEYGVVNTVQLRGQVFDGLDILSQTADAGFITSVTGSMIPGATTLNNENLFIETKINGVVAYQTGVIIKLNESLMDVEGDWVADDSPASDGQKRPYAIDLVGHNFFHTDSSSELEAPSFSNYFSYIASTYAAQPIGFNFATGDKTATYDPTKGTAQLDAIMETSTKFIVPSLFSIRINDRIVGANGNLTRIKAATSIGEKIYLPGLHTTHPLQASGVLFPKNSSGVYVYPVGDPNAGVAVARNTGVPTSDPQYGYPMTAPTGGTVIALPSLTSEQIATLKTQIGVKYVLIRVETVDPVIQLEKITTTTMTGNITFDDASTYALTGKTVIGVYFFITPDRFTPFYTGVTLDYYKPRKAQFLDGSSTTQTSVLNTLQQVGIRRSILADNFQIRYIVDSFKSFIEPEIKSQIATICKDKHILGLANFPFMVDFAKSTNPYFKSTPTAQLDAQYIAQGGNRDLPSSNVFTLPTYGDSNIAFFGPGFIASYYGQEIIVPPAAAVSKAFINKFIGGQPFDVVANTTGIVSGQNLRNLEYHFSDDDRKPLEKFGLNCIIQRNNGAFAIFGNQTAQNRINTALSKIHVRELVILIQERMKNILADYVFKFNNEQTRTEVKLKADNEMQTIQDNGGVQWFQNQCDSNNNTQEIIENDMGILDTYIIPARAAEKWVHRTTLQSGVINSFTVNQV